MAKTKINKKSFRLKEFQMINDPRIKEILKGNVIVNGEYDVPYVAGYSKDRKTVYIDRHFYPTALKENLIKYLLIHERTEKALLDTFHIKYQEAHNLATKAEENTVKKDGLNVDDYEDKYKPWIKELDHEKIEKVPKDLDLEPYSDMKDCKKFKIMHKLENNT